MPFDRSRWVGEYPVLQDGAQSSVWLAENAGPGCTGPRSFDLYSVSGTARRSGIVELQGRLSEECPASGETPYLLQALPKLRLPLFKRLEEVVGPCVTLSPRDDGLRATGSQSGVDQGRDLLVGESPVAVPAPEHGEVDSRQSITLQRLHPLDKMRRIVCRFACIIVRKPYPSM